MKTIFKNARIIGSKGELFQNSLSVENGIITSFDCDGGADEIIDCNGKYIVAGFIDVHVHGGGGYDITDCTPESAAAVVNVHLSHGTTSIYPTTVSCSRERLASVFENFRKSKAMGLFRSNVNGLHLEGPFLSPLMCGAQRPDLIIPPTDEDISLYKANSDIIKRITVAPEVPRVDRLIAELSPSGVKFSMGHTNATFEEADNAYRAGADSITHLYSATSGFHKINQKVHIGVTQYAYAQKSVYAELIGDGHHVPKELLRLVVSLKGTNRVCIVTDAMRAAGTDVTESYLGEIDPKNRVIIDDGVAKLPDKSSFAGSIGTMDNAFGFAVKAAGLSLSEASEICSLTPAKLMGIADKKGSVDIGKDADLLILNDELAVEKVFVGGKPILNN